ncbi:MAG: hypothetical protein ABFS35_12555 [Bacteroidota bacterium]
MNKLLIISVLIFNFVVAACNPSDKKNNNDPDQLQEKKELVRKLLIEDYDFAVLENKKFIPYNKAIYHRGDEVYMVLKNVGQFARGTDSLNHAEMKVEIFDAIGQRVSIGENFFGSKGHANFDDNIIKQPYAWHETDLNDKVGKYNFKVTIYDLISGDSTSVSDDFFIE